MNRVLILEDEKHTREFLELLIGRHPLVDGVISFNHASDAIQAAADCQPQLALLDIELEVEDSISGIDAARFIHEVSPRTEFIFVTGYGKYAIESFDVHPYDYILKPIHKERLLAGVGKILSLHQQDNAGRLVFRYGQGVLFLEPQEILYFEREGRKTRLVCHEGDGIEISDSLQSLQEHLPKNFLRVHSSFIVNLNNVHEVRSQPSRSWQIQMKGSDKYIPFSRKRYDELKDALFSRELTVR